MLTALRREHLPNNTLSWSHNMNCLRVSNNFEINPLNAELNPICHLLALLGAHHILHVSRIRVNKHSGNLLCHGSEPKYLAVALSL